MLENKREGDEDNENKPQEKKTNIDKSVDIPPASKNR